MTKWILDNLSVLISVIALVVSAFTLWWAHLAPARLKVLIGDRLYLVAPSGKEAPLNVALEIVNSGARTGVLQYLEMQITPPMGATVRFEWSQFYRYSTKLGGWAVEKESDPHPISLTGRSARPLSVQFVIARPAEDFTWGPRIYSAQLRGWHNRESRRERPNITANFQFALTEGFDPNLFRISRPGDPVISLPARVIEWT